ncbi:MAG TPA: DUF2793 domain-containing protein [Arsenicitalea sp.]|jgi:hypothetical protein|nr:DUF2793 domain-containing protein [Arsenicitalea sp.]
MDQSANLNLPYIMPSQAQKHITHNEAIRALDTLVQLVIVDRDLAGPPASPADGACYIVAASATGAWAGKSTQIAAFQDGGWLFYPPNTGWRAWIIDEDQLVAWNGSAWIVAAVRSVNPAALVGVNATADATNKLSVKSDAVLFSHDDVTPGTGNARATLNKSAAARTASLVFQDASSGRAEFGLTGDDDFHIKVSPNGTTWKEALVIDRTSGQVGIGTAAPARTLAVSADDASNAAMTPLLRLTHTTSGTPAAGIGAGVEFEVETATGSNTEIGMKLEAVATNVGSATENFDYVLSLMAGGAAAAEAFRVKSNGQLRLAAGATAANGTVATSLGSLGPSGAHTSVQKWLAIDIAGTTGWIPVF